MTNADKQEEKHFIFKVNGIEIHTTQQRILAHDILKLAKKAGAMPGNPEEYILQGDKGQYGQDAWVDLLEDSVFITILNTPTQVA